MAFPTAVNPQITDAVTQTNVKVVGEAPAVAMSSIYQSMAHSSGILFQNAVAAQQQQDT
ncbi:R body protein RebB-like protein, partial [Xanthomonas citri pv. citri]|nr:R body protein RebB-like protein [Xanthomonas citri pv. citri]